MKSWVVFAEVKNDLKLVEEELEQQVCASDDFLTETSSHLLKAGGKRLRPAFALLAGKFYNYNLERMMPLAVALEMIHMATLVHDDVVDTSLTRRGIPTVKAKWGNKISIHTGDFLLARSLVLVSNYSDPRISKTLAKVSVKMCQGEIQQIISAYDADQTIRDYFYRINRKTALLISASCKLGSIVSGAPTSTVNALSRYAHNLGMAFQITDDILDLTAKNTKFGKQVGSDLRQGIITLPIICALQNSPKDLEFRELIAKKNKTDVEIQQAIGFIKDNKGIEYANEISFKFLEKAKNNLLHLPDTKAKKAFNYIAEQIGKRQF
ncbi:heptaprenyl diphosphate synthase [Desulfitispora alkaliphila]|uniref:polyprenyl synthetase family protein n=1 Tax=Desulfitispora alkaliphila TaxID=622674 RepID=UPI003D209B81